MGFYGPGDLIFNGTDQGAFDLTFNGTGVLKVNFATGLIAERITGDVEASGTDLTFVDGVGDQNLSGTNIKSVRQTGDITADVGILALSHCAGALNVTGSEVTVTRHQADSKLVVFDFVDGGDVDVRSNTSTGVGVTILDCTALTAKVRVEDAQEHGVVVDGGTDIVVSGRVESSGEKTANTYDNVHLKGSTNTCRVSDVTSRPGTKTRYGTNVTAGCTDTILDQIDYGAAASYSTGISVDAGTNTRTGTNWNT